MDYEIIIIFLFALTYFAFGGRWGWASKGHNHPLAARVLFYVKVLTVLYLIVGAPVAWYLYTAGQKQAGDIIVIQCAWIIIFVLPLAYFAEYSSRIRPNK